MNVLITGGTGFIGTPLTSRLLKAGHTLTVLSRSPRPEITNVTWISSLEELREDLDFDAVINLAGQPIMAQRWNASVKKQLVESRVDLTRKLVERLRRSARKPRVLISGSAIGIYGDHGDESIVETSSCHGGFGHTLCVDWEAAALQAEALGIRVCRVRTGLVVGPQGGFLKELIQPFSLGLGGRLGSGQQWMSWIHLEDEIGIIEYLLDTPSAHGAFNLTAPQPVTNQAFTTALAARLRRPAWLNLPEWLLKVMLGERSELLLESARVLPERIEGLGYRFVHPTLDSALRAVLD